MLSCVCSKPSISSRISRRGGRGGGANDPWRNPEAPDNGPMPPRRRAIGRGITIGLVMGAGRQIHVVMIPSYHPGPRLFETIASVRALGCPVIVVIDGSTDGTTEISRRTAASD